MTSPPYCNRYDYTRTYALELAMLELTQAEVSHLRQEMLSCTVENREKDLLKICPQWAPFIEVANHQKLLTAINTYLQHEKASGTLNNNGIPRMVRGYFLEMACVIGECALRLKTECPPLYGKRQCPVCRCQHLCRYDFIPTSPAPSALKLKKSWLSLAKKETAVSKWERMGACHFGNVYMSGKKDNAIPSTSIHQC